MVRVFKLKKKKNSLSIILSLLHQFKKSFKYICLTLEHFSHNYGMINCIRIFLFLKKIKIKIKQNKRNKIYMKIWTVIYPHSNGVVINPQETLLREK